MRNDLLFIILLCSVCQPTYTSGFYDQFQNMKNQKVNRGSKIVFDNSMYFIRVSQKEAHVCSPNYYWETLLVHKIKGPESKMFGTNKST